MKLTLIALEDLKTDPVLMGGLVDMLSSVGDAEKRNHKNHRINHELFGLPPGKDSASALDDIDGLLDHLHTQMDPYAKNDRKMYAYVDLDRHEVIGMTGYLFDKPKKGKAEGFDLIHPAHRGEGLGKQIMADRLALATTLGNVDQVVFKVDPDNKPSMARVNKLIEAGLATPNPYNHQRRLHEFDVNVTKPQDWHIALEGVKPKDEFAAAFGSAESGKAPAPAVKNNPVPSPVSNFNL